MGSKYEALSIIVSSGGVSDFENGKLLGITKLESSTGRAQADASYDMLLMWQITNNAKALVFDTTSSNSGWKDGAEKIAKRTTWSKSVLDIISIIGGHGTLEKYRGTGTRYFAKISTAVPVLSN